MVTRNEGFAKRHRLHQAGLEMPRKSKNTMAEFHRLSWRRLSSKSSSLLLDGRSIMLNFSKLRDVYTSFLDYPCSDIHPYHH